MAQERRIGICGSSGAGKTTMAKFINEVTGIPYLFTKGEGLRIKYDCDSHRDVIKLSAEHPLKGLAFQFELLEERSKLVEGYKNFVMDRTLIDWLTYFLLQNSAFISPTNIKGGIEKAQKYFSLYTHIIMIPPLYDTPEEDGVRIQNLPYQQMTYGMMQYVLKTYFLKMRIDNPPIQFIELDNYDLAWRKKRVMDFIS